MKKPSSSVSESPVPRRRATPHRPESLGALLGLACLFPSQGIEAGSLWQDDVARPMFADKRAVGVGDILSVIVQENNSASKKKNTKTDKSSAMDASISSFFYSPAASGLLTKGVRVIDVLPNRNLVIEGTRESAFSGEQQTIVLRGVVRPDDITAGNSLYSYNIADATIRFVTKGTLTDSERKGWFNKVWDKVTPF
jgi:flagellar L-ring protein precursor FlgH